MLPIANGHFRQTNLQRKMLMKSMMAKRTPKAIARYVSQVGLAPRPPATPQTEAATAASEPGGATKTDVAAVTVSWLKDLVPILFLILWCSYLAE